MFWTAVSKGVGGDFEYAASDKTAHLEGRSVCERSRLMKSVGHELHVCRAMLCQASTLNPIFFCFLCDAMLSLHGNRQSTTANASLWRKKSYDTRRLKC